MPEWEAGLRKAIGGAGFDASREAEIYEEISGHLEDSGEFSRNDCEMLGCNLLQVRKGCDGDLRARRLWLPGFYSGVVSALLLRALLAFGPGLRAFWIPDPSRQSLVFCFQWLAMLPVVGAIIALYAAHRGAGSAERFLAAVFPAAMFGSIFVLGFIPRILFFPRDTVMLLPVFAATMLSWVILPGAALAAGALPAIALARNREGAR